MIVVLPLAVAWAAFAFVGAAAFGLANRKLDTPDPFASCDPLTFQGLD